MTTPEASTLTFTGIAAVIRPTATTTERQAPWMSMIAASQGLRTPLHQDDVLLERAQHPDRRKHPDPLIPLLSGMSEHVSLAPVNRTRCADRGDGNHSTKEGSMKRFALSGALAEFVLAALISAATVARSISRYRRDTTPAIQNQTTAPPVAGAARLRPAFPSTPLSTRKWWPTGRAGQRRSGARSWRISTFYTSGSFGDMPFSPSLTNEAGETMAQNPSTPVASGRITSRCNGRLPRPIPTGSSTIPTFRRAPTAATAPG